MVSDGGSVDKPKPVASSLMTSRLSQPGVLAVTRSLGDSSMKEFVVGSPYTTETTLGPDDDFLIVACDGVSGRACLCTASAELTGSVCVRARSYGTSAKTKKPSTLSKISVTLKKRRKRCSSML